MLALPMFFAYQLAVQSSLKHLRSVPSEISPQPLQIRGFPRSWSKTRKPWIVGCSVFEANLVNILSWAALPTIPKAAAIPELKEWLLDACQVVEEISLTFQGLSEHASLLRAIHEYMKSPERTPTPNIQFLERTNLYELCVQALGALEIAFE
ncbi:hypothetical protein NW759_012394 [Fusarium solani]|nr:hypothetical protein NW759_012394 [Fusarium solani]